MLNNDDVEQVDEHINEDGDVVKVLRIKTPYAVPMTRGMIGTVIAAVLVTAIIAPFYFPANLLGIAVANGIAALGWFILYRASSSAAARHFNECTLTRAVHGATMEVIEAQVAEMQEKIKGNLTDSDLSNEGKEEKVEEVTEPK